MDAEQIARLVDAKAPESLRLEFKRDLPTDSKEFARDVCAMANASGGTILFGISEKKGCADTITGVDGTDIDAEILRLTDILRAGIEPRLLRFSFYSAKLADKTVLALTVQQSMVRPHWVIVGGDRRFYVRHNSGKSPMSLDEIRESFIYGSSMIDRASTWRQERLIGLKQEVQSPCLDNDAIWFAVHICPLTAFSLTSPRFDPQTQYKGGDAELRTVFDGGGGKPTFDGWRIEVTHRDTKRPIDTLQVLRDFRMEVVFQAGQRSEKLGTNVLWAGENEKVLLAWLERFKRWASVYSFPYPALVFVTALNTGGSIIPGRYERHDRSTAAIMPLQPVLLENEDFDGPPSLREALDHLYQSYGFASCPHFDAAGQWKPRRFDG